MKEENNNQKINLDEVASLVVDILDLADSKHITIINEDNNSRDIRIILNTKEVHELLLRNIENIDLLHETYEQLLPKLKQINNSLSEVVYVVFICSDLEVFRDIKSRMRRSTEVKFHREETHFIIGFFVGYMDGVEINRFDTIKKN